MPRISLGLMLLAGALAAGPYAQNLQRSGESTAPTGLLMGVVIDALDGRAVASAEVTLGGAPATARNTRVLTDGEGRFVFLDLPKGTYTITATKPGYAEGAHGRRRPGGLVQAITLGDAERLADLKVPIWKLATVTGRVVDEAGEPMVGIVVQAMQRTVIAGKFKLAPGPLARTDDRGVYRIASLVPGDYAVVIPATQASAPQSVMDLYRVRLSGAMKPGESDFLREVSFSGAVDVLNILERHGGARVGTVTFLSRGGGTLAGIAPAPSAEGRMYVYPTQYYPSAPTPAEATVISLRSGEERASVDMQLKLVPASRMSGTVTGPDGPLIAVLSLAPDSDDLSTEVSFETATTMSDAAGRFTFIGVPEGRYRLRAMWVQVPVGGGGSRGAPPPTRAAVNAPPTPPLSTLGGYTLWATRTITIGAEDISALTVTLQSGYRIGGRAEFAGSKAQPAPDAIRRIGVTFDPADARPLVSQTLGRGQLDETGRLSSYQLPPGRYYVRVANAPAGWHLKSASVGGQDVSNVPLMLDRDVANVTISFTDRTGSLSGQVNEATGSADSSATVLIFPANSAGWSDYGSFPRRLQAVRVDRQAQFGTGPLPAGDYLVVAVPDEATMNWQDPAVLKSLARMATAVSIADGEPRTVVLRTVAVPR